MLQPFFVGTYSVPSPWAGAALGHGAGIVAAEIDDDTGEMRQISSSPEVDPAFVVAERQSRRIWAVTEVDGPGELVSWAIGESLEIGRRSRASTGADGPGHVTVDAARGVAYVCHFHGESLTAVALNPDGSPIGVALTLHLPAAADGPHGEARRSRPHCSVILNGDELLVTDFGTDLLVLYRITGSGAGVRLEPIEALALPVDTGPRHIAVAPMGGLLYVSNEKSAGLSVVCLSATAGRRLELLQTVDSPGLGIARSLPSEIAVHPDSKVVYMANRYDNSISVFAVDQITGRVSQRQAVDVRGDWPRHFAITPNGRLLVVGNQNSDSLLSFHIDAKGDLEWSGHQLSVASPASIAFW